MRCVWQHHFPERPLTLWGWLAELRSPMLTPNPLEVHEVLWLTAAEAVHHPAAHVRHKSAFSCRLFRLMNHSG